MKNFLYILMATNSILSAYYVFEKKWIMVVVMNTYIIMNILGLIALTAK